MRLCLHIPVQCSSSHPLSYSVLCFLMLQLEQVRCEMCFVQLRRVTFRLSFRPYTCSSVRPLSLLHIHD